VALVTEYNRRSYKRRSPLHTGRWLPMKTREARDMRDSSAPPEIGLSTTDEVRCRQKKKQLTRSCRRLPHCRKLERLQKALVYVHMKEEKNMRFDRVAASACQSLSVPIKKTRIPRPIYGNRWKHIHIRRKIEKTSQIATFHQRNKKREVAKLNSPDRFKKEKTLTSAIPKSYRNLAEHGHQPRSHAFCQQRPEVAAIVRRS